MGFMDKGSFIDIEIPAEKITGLITLEQLVSAVCSETEAQRTATLVVAASNSSALGKALADYVCDGSDDQVEIQAAIDALPDSGGEVFLLDGTYNIEVSLVLDSYQTLKGCGRSTILTTTTAGLAIITATGSDGNEKTDIVITDLQIDGGVGAISDCGIYFEYVDHSLIQNVYSRRHDAAPHQSGIYLYYSDFNQIVTNTCNANLAYGGIILDNSNNNTVSGNICRGNYAGIYIYIGNNNTVSGNICQGNDVGIDLDNSNNNTVSGNMYQGNNYNGLYLSGSNNNTIVGNTCQANGECGISSYGSNNNTIVGNTCVGNSQTTDNALDNIRLGNSSYNLILGNLCRDGGGANQPKYGINISNIECVENVVKENDLYDSGRTLAFVDGGDDTATPAIYIPVQNPDTNIGDHPALELPDAADTTFRMTFQVPLDFTQLIVAQIVIVPGGTGNMRRSFATDWGKLPKVGAGIEDYNAGSGSIAASGVAVTLNRVEGLSFNTALDGIDIGDVIGVTFTREGTHGEDTVNAACYALGLRIKYV